MEADCRARSGAADRLEYQRSLILISEPSSRLGTFCKHSRPPASGSYWTAKADGSTTSSSNDYGDPRNMRASTCTPGAAVVMPGTGSAITSAHMLPMTVRYQTPTPPTRHLAAYRANRPEAVRSVKIWNICEWIALSGVLHQLASFFWLKMRGIGDGFWVRRRLAAIV